MTGITFSHLRRLLTPPSATNTVVSDTTPLSLERVTHYTPRFKATPSNGFIYCYFRHRFWFIDSCNPTLQPPTELVYRLIKRCLEPSTQPSQVSSFSERGSTQKTSVHCMHYLGLLDRPYLVYPISWDKPNHQ